MRRKIAMLAVLGGLAAGFGCHHIAGKTDCGYNSANYPIPPATQPYPSYPVLGGVTVPPPKDPVVIPKTNSGGSDAKVKDKPGMGEGGY